MLIDLTREPGRDAHFVVVARTQVDEVHDGFDNVQPFNQYYSAVKPVEPSFLSQKWLNRARSMTMKCTRRRQSHVKSMDIQPR